MNVLIWGWDDEVEAELLKKFVGFSLKDELGEENSSTLDIRVEADINLLTLNKWGDVTILDPENEYPARFLIRVNRLAMTLQQTLRILGHELQHVIQFFSGEWQQTDDRFIHRWRGEWVDMRDLNNWREPWEVDARGAEKAFLENFVKEFDLFTEPWYSVEP